MASYEPYPTDIVMSPLGRWVVTWSLSPWQRMSVTVSSNPGSRDGVISASRQVVMAYLALTGKGVTT